MGRRIGAGFAGLATAMVLMMALQSLSVLIHPMPAGLDPADKAALADWIRTLPLGAFLIVLASYAIGSAAGGWVAGRIARPSVRPALVLGALLTLAGFANLASIPHPLWFAVLSTLSYVPCAWLGARWAGSGRVVATAAA